jgi:hypothetical protein
MCQMGKSAGASGDVLDSSISINGSSLLIRYRAMKCRLPRDDALSKAQDLYPGRFVQGLTSMEFLFQLAFQLDDGRSSDDVSNGRAGMEM